MRVIAEAITNAVIHRDYRLPADVMVRIFSDRIEVESPGLLAGPITPANIGRIGLQPQPADHSAPSGIPDWLLKSLDAGEGVRMMIDTMRQSGLYPPIYVTPPRLEREAVVTILRNENRPSVWEQVVAYIDDHGDIGNLEVRRLLDTDDTLTASKATQGVGNARFARRLDHAGRSLRRYTRADADPESPDCFPIRLDGLSRTT